MAEKAVLLDKLPPAQAAQTGQGTPAPTQTAHTAHSVQPDQAEVTATGFEKLTYYTFILDMLIFGIAGIFLLVKAHKNRAAVRYKAMIGYGAFLLALSFVYFYFKGAYASALWDPEIIPSLTPRAIIWAFLAPALLYLLSQLVQVEAGQRTLYLGLLAAAGALFLFIGISHLPGLPGFLAFIIGILPLISAVAIAALLYFTLTALPGDMPQNVRQSFTIVAFTIAGGWVLYPALSLLAHIVHAPSFYLFILNFADLAIIAGITYGIIHSLNDANAEPIAIRANLPSRASRDEPSDSSSEGNTPNGRKPAPPGKPKPKFRPPVAPSAGLK